MTLRAQLAEQSSSLLDNHPRIKELKAQIADLDKQIRKEAEIMARSLENDAKLADARVEAQLQTFDQLKSQAATTNEQDVQLRALERDAKSQRDLLESYLAKYREASARDTINSAPPDARVISRATVSNVPAYPKKLPTVLIMSLATLVLMSGMVLTRELLAGPARAATPMPGRAAGKALTERTPAPARAAEAPAAPAAASGTAAAPPARRRAGRGSFTDRIAAVIRRPQLPGIPISALEEFADNLRRESEDGTQIAVLGVAPGMDTTGAAITFARALADEARVVLVGLGAGDAEIKAISGDPSAAGLAELAQGAASFADLIAKDKYSALHLIVSGREPADRGALLSVPGMAKNFGALAAAYGHVVIDGGAIGGRSKRLQPRHGGALRNRPARAASGRDAVGRRHGGCARPAAGGRLRPCHDHRRRPRQHGAVQIRRRGVAELFIRPRCRAGRVRFRETIFAGPRHPR